jgi:hypothetical protein
MHNSFNFLDVFEIYEQVLKATFNLYIFMVDGLYYCYNFCTSYFWKLRVQWITDPVDNYQIQKVYYPEQKLNYFFINSRHYYDFYKDPKTGKIEQTVKRRVDFTKNYL